MNRQRRYARHCRLALGSSPAVVITDTFGRPWRQGVCGTAIGASGIVTLLDRRGERDRFGRKLKVTQVAIADGIAAAATLLMGEGGEGRPVVLARGLPPGFGGTIRLGRRSCCGHWPKICFDSVLTMQKIVALCGGVGGAKLADGLQRCLLAGRACTSSSIREMTSNTAGLLICPDLDTVLYTLAGVANVNQGWGRANETWHVQIAMARARNRYLVPIGRSRHCPASLPARTATQAECR